MLDTEKDKIKKRICELLDESFEVDDITEKKHNPGWVIVSYLLQKYNQRLKADVVIPMRPGRCLGPYFQWFPDKSVEDIKNMENDEE